MILLKNSVKIIFLFITLIIVNNCSSPKEAALRKFNVSKQEKILLEKFFRNIMFDKSAIFTLVGSKPITRIPILYYKKNNDQVSKEQNNNEGIVNDKNFIYNLEGLWDQWEIIQHKFPLSKKFLLIKKNRHAESLKLHVSCEKIYDVLFVNVFQTALVIQKNYELFKQAVGFDFDPLAVVLELEREHSAFWDTINGKDSYKYCYLWGLLYGFGKKNSFGYLWKNRHIKNMQHSEEEIVFSKTLTQHSSNKSSVLKNSAPIYSIANFPIPTFASFSNTDPYIKKYELERKKIQKLYKGKDFVSFTLQLLID